MSQYQPNILVIDDESGILETLNILLKNSGFSVETAQGGRAGLESLQSSHPDIVLTDVKMPFASGIDILKTARDLDPEYLAAGCHSGRESGGVLLHPEAVRQR